jgi:SAM-dependent methyltransferase
VPDAMNPGPELIFRDGPGAGGERRAAWWSESAAAPARAALADDRITADAALRRVRSGEGLVWAGDWHNARQLLAAMGRRLRAPRPAAPGLAGLFRAEREGKRIEHEVLSRLAVPIGPGWTTTLRRAPALEVPLREAFGAGPDRRALMPLREILGAIGAYEWLRRGVPVPALRGTIHPRYGVFAPVRGEYVDLVARALATRAAGWAEGWTAFDIGTGTGVLAILLARAGARVIATDLDPRAVACARENAERFGVAGRVQAVEADLFPPGRARLVVANPPWIPAAPHGPLDRAVYDPGGALLERLIGALADHLAEGAEAWLVLSDLAERLGLRPAGALEAALERAGLRVTFTLEAQPSHPRARDAADPLAEARRAERTRLYGLAAAPRRAELTEPTLPSTGRAQRPSDR